jgi:hypothetical protein
MSTNEQGEIVSEEIKKVSATLVPALTDLDRAPRPGFESKQILFAGGPDRPASHPLAAARAELAQAEQEFREACFQFQRELTTSVQLKKAEAGAWVCGKLKCEGKMQMGDGALRCEVCGRTCAANDEHLKWRAYPAETVFADEDAPARIRRKRAAMEHAEKARDEKRRQLVEGANEKNLELMAESGRARHKQ